MVTPIVASIQLACVLGVAAIGITCGLEHAAEPERISRAQAAPKESPCDFAHYDATNQQQHNCSPDQQLCSSTENILGRQVADGLKNKAAQVVPQTARFRKWFIGVPQLADEQELFELPNCQCCEGYDASQARYLFERFEWEEDVRDTECEPGKEVHFGVLLAWPGELLAEHFAGHLKRAEHHPIEESGAASQEQESDDSHVIPFM